jgi:hypothetical protein
MVELKQEMNIITEKLMKQRIEIKKEEILQRKLCSIH